MSIRAFKWVYVELYVTYPSDFFAGLNGRWDEWKDFLNESALSLVEQSRIQAWGSVQKVCFVCSAKDWELVDDYCGAIIEFPEIPVYGRLRLSRPSRAKSCPVLNLVCGLERADVLHGCLWSGYETESAALKRLGKMKHLAAFKDIDLITSLGCFEFGKMHSDNPPVRISDFRSGKTKPFAPPALKK